MPQLVLQMGLLPVPLRPMMQALVSISWHWLLLPPRQLKKVLNFGLLEPEMRG
jgi:hypothetical protein